MSSFFGIPGATPDQNVVNQQRAGQNIQNTMQQVGAAYSNKRQADRDMYANELNNRAASYQGVMNMLGASGGGVPNTAGLSRENNPLTLQGTMIGATKGSNATGWGGYTGGAVSPQGVPLRAPGAYGIEQYMQNGAMPSTGYAGQSFSGINQNGQPSNNGQPSLNTAPMNGGGPNGSPMMTPPAAAGSGFNFAPRRQ